MKGRKKHIVVGGDIDGLRETFCGRAMTTHYSHADDVFETPSEVVGKILKGVFRREMHCGSCLRAIELNELIYVHSEA